MATSFETRCSVSFSLLVKVAICKYNAVGAGSDLGVSQLHSLICIGYVIQTPKYSGVITF